MHSAHKLALAGVFVSVLVGPFAAAAQAPQDVPAYHAKAPKASEKLAPILKPEELPAPSRQYPFQVKAYQIAARIQRVLYQLPCYCRCDRSVGHTSLRDCYATTHGANCSTCLQELFYTERMLKQGKTAEQIRAGIEHGDYQSVDLQKI